jgi:hypothetical protein
MNWLVLSWALTIGYLPLQNDMIYTGKTTAQIIAPENALATSMYFEAQAFDCFKAWTVMRSYEEFSYNKIYMVPWRIDFSVGAELFYGPFAIGVWHECDHGVDSHANYLEPYYARGTTEIYISIRGKYEL